MELFAADGHDAGGCERVTGKSGMRPVETAPAELPFFRGGAHEAWTSAVFSQSEA